MENRWDSMIDDQYNFGFAVDLMVKDLEIVSLNIQILILGKKFKQLTFLYTETIKSWKSIKNSKGIMQNLVICFY